LLKEIDLKSGGKFGWAEYDGDADTAAGFWTDGNGVTGDSSVEDNAGAKLTSAPAGIKTLASTDEYADTTANIEVDGDTNMGAGRKGLVRVSGFGTTIYREVDLSSTSLQTGGIFSSIPVVNPSNGNKKKFTIEVLDENYGLLTKVIQTIQIDVDADAEPPPSGGSDDDDGGYSGGGST